MAQQSRALVALAENSGSNPSSHVVLGDLMHSYELHAVIYIHMYIQAKHSHRK